MQGALASPEGNRTKSKAVKEYGYRIITEHPQSRDVFTQGLEFHSDLLYQSSGLYGRSFLSSRQLKSATPVQKIKLDNDLFAEGITILNDKLYLVTWKEQTAIVFDLPELVPVKQFAFKGQGWGLTNNGKELIMSDGTNALRFIDPEDFSVIKRLQVTHAGQPLSRINELEWVNGLIYANIWASGWVVIIDPESGQTQGFLDLTELLPKEQKLPSTDVLNGIAYLQDQNRLFVTGKNWPILYEIRLTPFKSSN